jgi:hypothetical protein
MLLANVDRGMEMRHGQAKVVGWDRDTRRVTDNVNGEEGCVGHYPCCIMVVGNAHHDTHKDGSHRNPLRRWVYILVVGDTHYPKH